MQERVLDALESRDATSRGYTNPTQSTYVRTGVNIIMTRFAPTRCRSPFIDY